MYRRQTDVLVTAAVALLTIGAVLLGAPTAVMVVLGMALLAAPGYVWSRVLLGSHTAGLERVAIATALSLAVPVLGGLALYGAGVALSRLSWASLLACVSLTGDGALLALRRARKAPPFRWRRPGPKPDLPLRHIMAFSAAVIIAAAGVGLAYTGAARQRHPGFTELWLVPRHGVPPAADIGVTNHQHTAARYRLEVLRSGHATVIRTLTLASGKTWHSVILFGGSPTIDADLYRFPDLTHPYRHVLTNDYGAP